MRQHLRLGLLLGASLFRLPTLLAAPASLDIDSRYGSFRLDVAHPGSRKRTFAHAFAAAHRKWGKGLPEQTIVLSSYSKDGEFAMTLCVGHDLDTPARGQM